MTTNSVPTDASAGPPKPTPLTVCFDSIPHKLRGRDRWCLWRYELRTNHAGDKKWTKVPVRNTGKAAKSNDPATWMTFEQVRFVYGNNVGKHDAFAGVGFFLGADPAAGLHWLGIDWDHVVGTDGSLLPWAAQDIDSLRGRAYLEYSPSGTGIKAILLGTLDPDFLKRSKTLQGGGSVECYDCGRFFTLTGRILPPSIGGATP